jgi:fatty acid-binding protein DegV
MKIVMDDAGDIRRELVDELKIIVVPVNIAFSTGEFHSGKSMSHARFCEKAKQVGTENFPKTSQPTPYKFDEAYRKLFSEGVSMS